MTTTTERLIAVALALWLSGCTQWHYDLGSPVERNVAEGLDAGTPMADVFRLLGPPQRISSAAPGYQMAWEHWRIRENALGISLGALGVDFLSLDWGDARVRGQFLVVAFDREHKLTAASLGTWDSRRGSGRAIQPPGGFADVIDVDDLVGRMPQHTWGANLLEELPRALNSRSTPDLGGTGIEQRGTPTGVGQRALEMN